MGAMLPAAARAAGATSTEGGGGAGMLCAGPTDHAGLGAPVPGFPCRGPALSATRLILFHNLVYSWWKGRGCESNSLCSQSAWPSEQPRSAFCHIAKLRNS